MKLTAKRLKILQNALPNATRQPDVIASIHKPGKVEADPLHGLFEVTLDGKRAVVEYEPDSDLRDTEQVPLLEPGGIEAFIRREVLPHAARRLDRREQRPRSATRSASRGISTSRSRSVRWRRSAPTSWRSEKETEGLLGEILGTGPAGPMKASV